MTTGPESPERDPALERAWRAHSREAPPAALDRAILAAAHRAVGSGPAEVAPAREANRPQRWWMPLAAAATIGAVAVGLLQMSPQDASIVAPTERIAAVAPQRELAKAAPAAASAPAPAPAQAAAPARPAAQAAASAPASRTSPAPSASPSPPSSPPSTALAPSRAVPAPASPPAANEAIADRKQDAQPPLPRPAPVVPAPPPPPPAAPAPPATTAGARDAPAVVGKLAERTPDPFPAASAPRKAESAEAKPAAPAADGAASAGAAAGGVAQAARTEPTLPVAEDKRALARKDAAEADRQMSAAAPAAMAAPRAAPPPPVAETRARENASVRDASREQVAPAASALAKRAAPAEDARTKARDPDAWIAQIRRLRDEGRTAEAIRELRDFREFVPDAERRIPPDLRELAAAVRP